jgi:hypothetical protein
MEDREGCCPKGTPYFMSRNCHRGKKLSRRDDLESLMYSVITILNGYSPWQNLTINSKQDPNEVIMNMKEEYWENLHKVVENLPSNFKKFASLIKNMEFDQEPPYEEMIDSMSKIEVSESWSGSSFIKDFYKIKDDSK